MNTITFYCSVVFLVALYGFEYWPTIKDNKRRFADMGTKMLLRCRVRWYDHAICTNNDSLVKIDLSKSGVFLMGTMHRQVSCVSPLAGSILAMIELSIFVIDPILGTAETVSNC